MRMSSRGGLPDELKIRKLLRAGDLREQEEVRVPPSLISGICQRNGIIAGATPIKCDGKNLERGCGPTVECVISSFTACERDSRETLADLSLFPGNPGGGERGESTPRVSQYLPVKRRYFPPSFTTM